MSLLREVFRSRPSLRSNPYHCHIASSSSYSFSIYSSLLSPSSTTIFSSDSSPLLFDAAVSYLRFLIFHISLILLHCSIMRGTAVILVTCLLGIAAAGSPRLPRTSADERNVRNISSNGSNVTGNTMSIPSRNSQRNR